ncbi:hypothetical protein WA026_018626 [Henosepilachna vigintioctopunctata]|uniref:Endonuclease-reverse transcriptase n=1 Tax=Henosepilachna vigintioctopunctata TaxID=420089 RepID=A0AAW1UA83_9CUCU
MAFKGKEPIRTKIIIENKCIEQVSHFTYLGCDITYDYDDDMVKKLHNFQRICGTLSRTLRRRTRKETQIKLYKVMATPTLLYGSETWTLNTRDLSRIQAAEMRYLRSVKGCTLLDRIRNDDIRRELKIFNLCDRIREYRNCWQDHVQRMTDARLPKAAFNYRPKGRRDRGRPRKRWLEQ